MREGLGEVLEMGELLAAQEAIYSREEMLYFALTTATADPDSEAVLLGRSARQKRSLTNQRHEKTPAKMREIVRWESFETKRQLGRDLLSLHQRNLKDQVHRWNSEKARKLIHRLCYVHEIPRRANGAVGVVR